MCVTWPALFLRISCYDHQICITAWQVELHLWASECRVCNSVRPDLLCSSELGMWWPARWHLQPQICVRVCVCVCVCVYVLRWKFILFSSATLTFSLPPPSLILYNYPHFLSFHLHPSLSTQVVTHHGIAVKRAPHLILLFSSPSCLPEIIFGAIASERFCRQVDKTGHPPSPPPTPPVFLPSPHVALWVSSALLIHCSANRNDCYPCSPSRMLGMPSRMKRTRSASDSGWSWE